MYIEVEIATLIYLLYIPFSTSFASSRSGSNAPRLVETFPKPFFFPLSLFPLKPTEPLVLADRRRLHPHANRARTPRALRDFDRPRNAKTRYIKRRRCHEGRHQLPFGTNPRDTAALASHQRTDRVCYQPARHGSDRPTVPFHPAKPSRADS